MTVIVVARTLRTSTLLVVGVSGTLVVSAAAGLPQDSPTQIVGVGRSGGKPQASPIHIVLDGDLSSV